MTRVAGTGPADPAGVLLDGALGWLHGQLDWFRPTHWARHLPIREFDAQPALELLLLARSLDRDAPAAGPLVEAALDVAANIVDSTEFRTRLLRRDHLFRYWLFLLALLHAGRRPRPDLLGAVQAMLDADPDPGPQDPVERVELRYVLDLAGLRAPLGELPELAAAALRSLDRGAAELSDNDVYGLTHLVLYAADLGASPLPVDAAAVRLLVRALLPAQLDRADHDLTAELLLCAQVVDLGGDPLVLRGWRALAAARHDDGAVPSPPYDPVVEAGLEGGVRAGYRFATRYHTTLVTALAAADRLRRPVEPSGRVGRQTGCDAAPVQWPTRSA